MDAKSTTTLVYHLEGLTPDIIDRHPRYGTDVDELRISVRTVAQREFNSARAEGTALVDNRLPVNHSAGYLRANGVNLDAILIFNVDTRVGESIEFPPHYIEKGVEELTGYLKKRDTKDSVRVTKKGHIESNSPPLDDYTLLKTLGLLPDKT